MSHFRVICWLTAATVGLSLVSPHETSADRPNVVVMLADDAGWGDYGVNGNLTVQTPHIDSLARDGVRLTQFYVCPVCSPTRAEFLTGRYHPRGGVRGVSTGQERLNLDERTIADAFRAAGYATGAFGKWHNGSQWPYHPQARGFDEYFGHTSGHWGEYFDPPLELNGRMIREQGYIVDVCTNRALDFIERHSDRPFFCYVPFTTPHSPWAAPKKNWDQYREKSIAQPATNPQQERLDETRCALAMVENQDENVGRILNKLAETGLAEKTIVVYFSDNGPNSWRWNGGLKGRKGSTDEGGVRSIALIRWPARIPAGRDVTQIAGAIDLLPTLTSLAKIERVGDKPLDGRDLSLLLLGSDSTPWSDRPIFSTWAGKVSVRTQQHRLDERGELFDMQRDPGQTLPITRERPEVAAELRAVVARWRAEMFPPDREATMPRGQQVDPRPISVGYPEFPITMLPARDGTPVGEVRRSSSAPNCSYFVNWSSGDDQMLWNLEVVTAGRYEVVIDQTCRAADVGADVELACGSSRLVATTEMVWDPPLYTNQDTLPRPPAESQMKEFRPWRLGEIILDRGPQTLSLKALRIPGQGVLDVRRVTLTLLGE